MKDIKDYLHLYLGCPIQFERQTPAIVGDWKSRNNTLTVNYLYELDIGVIRNVKPILRKLDSMTEEEVREFVFDIMHFTQKFPFDKFEYKIENGFLTWIDSREHHVLIKRWGNSGEWIFNCSYSMNDVVWLLKKGFDLFGLIDEGLAIDRASLTVKSES